MDKLLAAVFNSQREADGQTRVTRDSPPGALGTAVCLLSGSVIGLLGGPSASRSTRPPAPF